MSEFSRPKGKITFHLGDVIALLRLYSESYSQAYSFSVPEKSPRKPDNTFYPVRADRLIGLIQLTEYVTKKEVPCRIRKQTGAPDHIDIAENVFLRLSKTASKKLATHYPELVEMARAFEKEVPQKEQGQGIAIVKWLEKKAAQMGDGYCDVEKARIVMPRKKKPLSGGGEDTERAFGA